MGKRGPKPHQPPAGFLTVKEAAEVLGVTEQRVTQLCGQHDGLAFKGDSAKAPWSINAAMLDWQRAGLPINEWVFDHHVVDLLQVIAQIAGPAAVANQSGEGEGIVLVGMLLATALLRINGEQPSDPKMTLILRYLRGLMSEAVEKHAPTGGLQDAIHQIDILMLERKLEKTEAELARRQAQACRTQATRKSRAKASSL